jgi:hypothetical protein
MGNTREKPEVIAGRETTEAAGLLKVADIRAKGVETLGAAIDGIRRLFTVGKTRPAVIALGAAVAGIENTRAV